MPVLHLQQLLHCACCRVGVDIWAENMVTYNGNMGQAAICNACHAAAIEMLHDTA
jgi:hypothetical protein